MDLETIPLETEVIVREHRCRPKRTLEEKFKGIPVEEVIVDDLSREEKDWIQYGAEISRTTLGNRIIDCAEKYFFPLYEYFHWELLKRRFAMADETRIQVLKEPGRRPQTDSFMWLFRSGEDGKPQIVLYWYTETRAGYNAKEFLKGFSGCLTTDGYSGYNELTEVTRCCCWAHVRRYFVDAVSAGQESDMSVPAVQSVAYRGGW